VLYGKYKIDNTQDTPPEMKIHHHIDNSFFPWQNEHTDFLEATEFCAKTEAKLWTKGKMSNFMILDFLDKAESKQSLLEELWTPRQYTDKVATMMPYSRDRINIYKQKMLGN